MPRRTRALPALASPFSRRFEPLSSKAPQRHFEFEFDLSRGGGVRSRLGKVGVFIAHQTNLDVNVTPSTDAESGVNLILPRADF